MWIARDIEGSLCLYKEEPYKTLMYDNPKFVFWESNGSLAVLPEDWFPEVTAENSPQEVELKVIEN